MNDAQKKIPRVPGDDHRQVIVGQTGSGKTVLGLYMLARRSYDRMPWIVVNYKNDEYLNQIGAEEISPFDDIPDRPGLFMVRPEAEEGSLDPLLNAAYKRGGFVGFYIDEGYCVGRNSKAFRRVLTQGRSLRIPVITLSQRPVWMDKFVFTEANFISAFPLLSRDDRLKVVEWLPETDIYGKPVDVNYPSTLAEYQSLYFDAGKSRLVTLGAVPFGQEVLDIFARRRPPSPKKTQRI